MADSVKIKSGALGDRSQMPKLAYDETNGSELGFRTDEKALYIGTKEGNVRLCGAGDIAAIREYIDGLVAGINTRIDTLTAPNE